MAIAVLCNQTTLQNGLGLNMTGLQKKLPVSNRVIWLVQIVDPVGCWQTICGRGAGGFRGGSGRGTQGPPLGGVHTPQSQEQPQWRP